MISSTIKNLPKATVEIEAKIPWADVTKEYEKVFEKVAGEMEISGFRKGKAPKDLVEKNINKNKLYEEVIRQIVPQAYSSALKEHHLAPIASPKIEIVNAKEGEDWQFRITIAQRPKINLKNYKQKIAELKKSKTKIWTPKDAGKKEEQEKGPGLNEKIEVLLKEAETEIPDLLVEEETNRLLADLIEQTQKLGLNIDQYLAAKGKTQAQIRAEYAQQASQNLKLELVLNEIADSEKITVSPEDIEKLLSKVENPQEKEKLKGQHYYLAHLIRRQKTLDFLSSL